MTDYDLAVLPGLFKKQFDPAKRTDVQGIIQWKLFGDPKHTGNGMRLSMTLMQPYS